MCIQVNVFSKAEYVKSELCAGRISLSLVSRLHYLKFKPHLLKWQVLILAYSGRRFLIISFVSFSFAYVNVVLSWISKHWSVNLK